MQGTPLTKNVTTTTTPDELQVRNGQDHQRVYDPELLEIQKEILEQIKEANFHLRLITGEGYEG